MAIGYVAEVQALFDSNDSFHVYGITAISLAGTTITFTCTGSTTAGVYTPTGTSNTVVSMLSASSIHLYKGSTWFQGPAVGEVSTHTSGSTAFDSSTQNISPSIGDSYTNIRGQGVSSI